MTCCCAQTLFGNPSGVKLRGRGGIDTAVEPQELVKKSGGLEKASAHWHAVVYANKLRADGHVRTILPERDALRKRQNGSGQHHHPRSQKASLSLQGL